MKEYESLIETCWRVEPGPCYLYCVKSQESNMLKLKQECLVVKDKNFRIELARTIKELNQKKTDLEHPTNKLSNKEQGEDLNVYRENALNKLGRNHLDSELNLAKNCKELKAVQFQLEELNSWDIQLKKFDVTHPGISLDNLTGKKSGLFDNME